MGAEHSTPSVTSGLDPDAQDHLQAASLVLRRYGLNLATSFDEKAGHDVLMGRIMPRDDLEYRHVLADMGGDGALGPRLKTSYYRGHVSVTIFEAEPRRPVLEVNVDAQGRLSLTVLDSTVPVRLSMEGTTYDLTEETPPGSG